MLGVKNPQNEPEREIFSIDRSDRKQECSPPKRKTVRVRFFDMVAECLRGKGYVEMEISDDDEAFQNMEKRIETINIKNEDI